LPQLLDSQGLLYIVTAILSLTILNLTNRLATSRSKTLWGVLFTNYLTALTISCVLFIFYGSYLVSWFTIGLGLVTGGLYVGAMTLGLKTMKLVGASIAASINQLSVLIPVSFSVLLFGEILRNTQYIGIALAITSLPLLAYKTQGGNISASFNRTLVGLMILTLIIQGLAQVSSKILVAFGLSSFRSLFFLAVFTSATVLTFPLAYRNRSEIKRDDLTYGFVVGVCNISGNSSILLALQTLNGAIVFPIVNALALLLITFAARLIFREKISIYNAAGITLTLLAVVLLNI